MFPIPVYKTELKFILSGSTLTRLEVITKYYTQKQHKGRVEINWGINWIPNQGEIGKVHSFSTEWQKE